MAGSAYAALVLLTARGSAAILIAGTAFGVALGKHVESGRHSVSDIGTQFTLAVLVTLVPDSYADAAVGPALARLSGVLLGLVLLVPVLILSHLLLPARSSYAESPVITN